MSALRVARQPFVTAAEALDKMLDLMENSDHTFGRRFGIAIDDLIVKLQGPNSLAASSS